MILELYRDKSGRREYRWRVWSRNGRNMANSGEGYKTKGNLMRAVHVIFGHYLLRAFRLKDILDNT